MSVPRRLYLGIQVPAPATLNKYGLSEEDWQAIVERQGAACGACAKTPKTARLNIDHEHVRGWAAMPTKDRAPFVRGLLCYMCNHYRLARGATPDNLAGAARYLREYEERKREAA